MKWTLVNAVACLVVVHICIYSSHAKIQRQNIVSTYWFGGHSHMFQVVKAACQLTEHKVTLLAAKYDEPKVERAIANCKHISVKYIYGIHPDTFEIDKTLTYKTGMTDFYLKSAAMPIDEGLQFLSSLPQVTFIKSVLENKDLMQWLEEQHFDYVLGDQTFSGTYVLHKALHIKNPAILVMCAGRMAPWMDAVGHFRHLPSYYPQFGIPFSSQQIVDDFNTRLINVQTNYALDPALYQTFFGRIEKYMQDNGILDSNEHFSDYEHHVLATDIMGGLTPVTPQAPNHHQIGPLTVSSDVKPLPKELAEFVAGESTVIYVSFGSWASLPSIADVISLLRALEALNESSNDHYKFIWKQTTYTDFQQKTGKVIEEFVVNEAKDASDWLLPSWLPQSDLLAHNNVKAAILHGGYNGLNEAAYHGVPVVIIPLMGDQEANAASGVGAGFAVRQDKTKLTTAGLLQSLRTILSDKYQDKAKQISAISKTYPGEKAVTNIVHNIFATNGAHHLFNIHYNKLSKYELIGLDIDLYIARYKIAGGLIAFLVAYGLLFHFIVSCLCASSASKVKSD